MGHGHMVVGSGLSLHPAVSLTFVLEGNQTRRPEGYLSSRGPGTAGVGRAGPHAFSASSMYSWKRNICNKDGPLGSPNFHSETVGDSQSMPLQPIFRQNPLSLFQT